MDRQNGFFDLQVNGYGGVDFNRDDLSADGLHQACQRLEADGVAGILATIISDDLDRMARRLANLAALRERDPLGRRMIAGFHIEGPFIHKSPGYRGVHRAEAIRPADPQSMEALLDAAAGLTRIVTLAPERDSGLKVTRMLADRGVIASAGHCNPTLDQLRAAIDAGLTMFTHLGNGCPHQMDRHDNIIQRALSLHDRLWLCFIADGVHIPAPGLGNYLRAAGIERSIAVTDAIAAAGAGPGRYTLGGQEVVVEADMVAHGHRDRHLIGSAATMQQAMVNLVGGLGLAVEDARRLTVTNPCRAIGLVAEGGLQSNPQAEGVWSGPGMLRYSAK
jgi:N-acetylglucosamine-6-phosphate deacetylase